MPNPATFNYHHCWKSDRQLNSASVQLILIQATNNGSQTEIIPLLLPFFFFFFWRELMREGTYSHKLQPLEFLQGYLLKPLELWARASNTPYSLVIKFYFSLHWISLGLVLSTDMQSLHKYCEIAAVYTRVHLRLSILIFNNVSSHNFYFS